MIQKCKGTNCGATDGKSHSPECVAEHEQAYAVPAALPPIPQGWQLVPTEPTPAMREAGSNCAQYCCDEVYPNEAATIYRAMLAAAPEQQTSLHPRTADLVDRFALALKEKLGAAEVKYGYSDGWADPNWMDQCRAKLIEHVHKGDPRDVAAYCAFLWFHNARCELEDQFIYDVTGKWPTKPARGVALPRETEKELGACSLSRATIGDRTHDRRTEERDQRVGEEKHGGREARRCDATRTGGAESGARGGDAAQHEVKAEPGPSAPATAGVAPVEAPSWKGRLRELLLELRPMTAYGVVGSRDVDQARYRAALDEALAMLPSGVPASGGKTEAPTDARAEQFARAVEGPRA